MICLWRVLIRKQLGLVNTRRLKYVKQKYTSSFRDTDCNLTIILIRMAIFNMVLIVSKSHENTNQTWIDIFCVAKTGYIVFLCAIELHSRQKKIFKKFFFNFLKTQWTSLMHWLTCSFNMMKMDTVLYFESISHTMFCCRKILKRMCINPQFKIVRKYPVLGDYWAHLKNYTLM